MANKIGHSCRQAMRGSYALICALQEWIKTQCAPPEAENCAAVDERPVQKRPRADLHMEKAPEKAAIEAPVNYTELHNTVRTIADDNVKLKDKVAVFTVAVSNNTRFATCIRFAI